MPDRRNRPVSWGPVSRVARVAAWVACRRAAARVGTVPVILLDLAILAGSGLLGSVLAEILSRVLRWRAAGAPSADTDLPAGSASRPRRVWAETQRVRPHLTLLADPLRVLVPLVAMGVALGPIGFAPGRLSLALHALFLAFVVAFGWFVARLVRMVEEALADHFDVSSADNLRARQARTQMRILRRVLNVLISLLVVSICLLSFPEVRVAGAGLLASAGVIGIVAGLAAKPLATNVLAGLQLALTQPIRVDDVVVIEGHWGRIEEIYLTYVVVKIWDLRRLIVPISYFIENPFENWTHRSSKVLGWAHLEVDYTAPVGELRTELERIVRVSPDWDGDVIVVQVTGAGPSTIELRALMSSRDSSASWNLQCEVREKLIGWLQEHHPTALPRLRTELSGPPPAGVTDEQTPPASSTLGVAS